MNRYMIESLIGGVLAAIITFAFTLRNIPAAIGTFVLGVPAGYFGCCLREKRQKKHSAC